MIWKDHLEIQEGDHAFLGASKYSWLNYDEEKLVKTYKNFLSAQVMGTRLHALACEHIKLGLKMPKSRTTLNMYINDAIGFKMRPEQVLYYSPNAYGTADAIAFKEKDSFLRIHDLKTGTTPASLHQLEIYAALFCLEYKVKPGDIEFELRIYQNDDILIGQPRGVNIAPIVDKIITFDKVIERLKQGE